MNVGGLIANFKYLEYPEWGIHAQHGAVTVVNNFTNDEFQYVTCTQNCPGLADAYRARAAYRIPLTPQIILPVENNQNQIGMLVERGRHGVQKLIQRNNCQTSARELIKKISEVIEYLIKKYGFFTITPKMITLTNSFKILVWINEDYSKMVPSLPFFCSNYHDACKTVALNLISILQEAGVQNKLQRIKRRVQLERSLTFQKFRYYIDNSLKCGLKYSQTQRTNSQYPSFLTKDRVPGTSVEKRNKQKLTIKRSFILDKDLSSSKSSSLLEKSLSFKYLSHSTKSANPKRSMSSYQILRNVEEMMNPQKTRSIIVDNEIKQDKNEEIVTPNSKQEETFCELQDKFNTFISENAVEPIRKRKTTLVQLETELNQILSK